MKSLETVENEIIEEFKRYPDIDSKYACLFSIANALPKMDPSIKNEDTLVKGCQSQLWFYLSKDDEKVHLVVDSDSMVIKGIGGLFVRLVEDRRPEELLDLSLDFIDRLEIWKLPSHRNNGLLAMINHLHKQAKILTGEHDLSEDTVS